MRYKQTMKQKNLLKLCVSLFATVMIACSLTIGLVFGLTPKITNRDTEETKLKTADFKRPKVQLFVNNRKRLNKSKLNAELINVRLQTILVITTYLLFRTGRKLKFQQHQRKKY